MAVMNGKSYAPLRGHLLRVIQMGAVFSAACAGDRASTSAPTMNADAPPRAAVDLGPANSAPTVADAAPEVTLAPVPVTTSRPTVPAATAPVASFVPKVPDAGAAPRAAKPPWNVDYKLIASEMSTVTWCSKTATATCFHGPPEGESPGQPTGTRNTTMSKRFASCPAAREVACEPCRHCGGIQPTTACAEPLIERVTASERARFMDAGCYSAGVNCGYPGEGRLLRAEGSHEALRPSIAERSDWNGRAKSDAKSDDAAIASYWARVGCMEHASVSSFAKTSLELARLGAPAHLLRDVHLAALDEIRHAEIAFEIATRYGTRDVGPSAYAMPIALTTAPMDLFRETFLDGCVGETIGAVLLGHAAERAEATAPTVAASLRRMARDEERHAELAWRTLAWLRGAFPSCRELSCEALLSEVRGMPFPGATPYLSAELARKVASDLVREVVAPCLGALVA